MPCRALSHHLCPRTSSPQARAPAPLVVHPSSSKPVGLHAGDKRTAQDAYLFVEGFLQRFPGYKGRPLWLAGESYGDPMLLFPPDLQAWQWLAMLARVRLACRWLAEVTRGCSRVKQSRVM